MAAAQEISMDVAIVAVLSEVDGVFTLKEWQKNNTEGISHTLFSLYFQLALARAVVSCLLGTNLQYPK